MSTTRLDCTNKRPDNWLPYFFVKILKTKNQSINKRGFFCYLLEESLAEILEWNSLAKRMCTRSRVICAFFAQLFVCLLAASWRLLGAMGFWLILANAAFFRVWTWGHCHLPLPLRLMLKWTHSYSRAYARCHYKLDSNQARLFLFFFEIRN